MVEETKTKTKQVPYRVVSQTDKSALVEWFVKGAVKRGTLPIEKVPGDKIDQELLDAAIPYGVPWAEMPIKQFTGDQFQDAMYKADLWTQEQVCLNAQKVIGVLITLYRVHLASMVEFAASRKQ